MAFRRRVFYIPGFDPFPPRKYREIYRREGAAQARISGYDLSMKPSKGGWTVKSGDVETQVEVLVWTDIVQASMQTGIAATYLQLVRTAWTYIASGALFRLARLRKGPVIAALYPVVALLLQLAVALLAGWLVAQVPWGWLASLPVAWLVLRWFRRHDRILAWYLMHDYAFSARYRGANPPALEARMEAFRQRVAEAVASEVDEVLVVGHSSGAYIGVSVVADVLRGGAEGPLALLTLGQVVPMVSFLPEAKRLRADLHDLATADVPWVDVTAPGDGCAFALCDPVAVSGVAPEGKRWPLVVSAAFSQTLSPERWRALRWKFWTLHFQYLHAFDRGNYDYFAITAGPMTLRERYAGRAPSKSRIETPLSGFTDR
ncbi:hypothetical protein QCN27_01070 [Cereibacter sp. SYSU M97828]|nr:hypothetical protein [Cereibacter flavus]